MVDISIFIGSVYGTARALATDIRHLLEDLGHTVELIDEPQVDDLPQDDRTLLLICTSTTGAGDLPEDIEPLYNALKNQPQSLAHLRYLIINLGDSSFDTFCGAGELLDDALQDLGASNLGEILKIDACETPTPEDVALPWTRDQLDQITLTAM